MCACEYTVVWYHLNGLSIPGENEGMGAFWVLNSTLMFYMSLLIHVPHCLHYYNSVLSRDWKLLSLLLFKDCFYSLGFQSFPHRFLERLISFCKIHVEFWKKLHWLCRALWGVLPPKQCEVFPSIYTGYISIFLGLKLFLPCFVIFSVNDFCIFAKFISTVVNGIV